MKLSITKLDSMIKDLSQIVQQTTDPIISLKAKRVGRCLTDIRESIIITIKSEV